MLGGVHATERDQRSMFRWSTGDTTLDLYPLSGNSPLALAFAFGPAPPELHGMPLELHAQGQVLAQWPQAAQSRRYYVLLPAHQPLSAKMTVSIHSATVTVPPDIRPVGARIEAIKLKRIGSGIVWPALSVVVLQTLILLLFAATVRMIAPASWSILATLGISVLLGFGFVLIPWLYTLYCARLGIALAILAAGTVIGLPQFTRMMSWMGAPSVARAVWVMALLACAVRLAGAVYPLFSAYDLTLNVDRFLRVSEGNLVAFNESFEFKGNVTVYPAGPYLLLLIGTLFGLAPAVVVQVGISLIDGWSVVLVAVAARRFGASAGASIIAALLMALMPISLTSLYYGHTAQIFGQALMIPLVLLLLNALGRPQPRLAWFGAAAVLAIALLTHVGVAVLAVTWLGLLWLVLVRRRTPLATILPYSLVLGCSILVGFIFVYAPVVQTHLAQFMRIGATAGAPSNRPAYALIAKAYWIAYTPLGILLLGPGLAILMQHIRYPAKQLILCWLAAAGVFAIIELGTGLQVRYLVFLAPLVAIAAAVVLDELRMHSRLGWCVAGGMLSFWITQAAIAWYSGTFANIAPSMIPLLR